MHRYHSPAARFSNRALMTHAQAGLPQTLGLRPRAAADQPAEILLYDEIGLWGTTAKDFIQTLAQAGDGDIVVRINSPGGDVFDGLAMFAALQAHAGNVSVIVDGIAASAASFIALAGASVAMAENAFLMIHNAWGVVVGNRNDMTETASVLSKIDGQLASLYAQKTGQTAEAMGQLMDTETWFTAQEAKDAGFVDSIISGGESAKASLRPGVFNRIPPALAASSQATTLTDLAASLASRRRLIQLAEAENAA
ncbi:MAG: head maturation protease, ClpP-related [Gluconacetobacter liquefaciens]